MLKDILFKFKKVRKELKCYISTTSIIYISLASEYS